jgi:hypothetical protein
MSLPETVRGMLARWSLLDARQRVVFVFAITFGVVLWTAQRTSAAGLQIFTATLTGAQQMPSVSSSGTGPGVVRVSVE